MAARRILSLLLLLALAGGCARPYSGPKTLAAIGAGLLAGGAALWVAGERTSRNGLNKAGIGATAAGAGAAVAAGGWLAATTACRADPDCPDDEACKEIPAPPGREPYKQCMRR